MNKINYTVTEKRVYFRRYDHGERMIDGAKVFVSDNLTKLIDGVFSTEKVYEMEFRSRAWSRLGNIVTRIIEDAIRDHFSFSDDVKVQFSHKAGCSCSCSPGYNVKPLKRIRFRNVSKENQRQYHCAVGEFREKGIQNSNIYLTIVFSEDAIERVNEAIEKFKVKFAKEKEKFESKETKV